MKYSIRLNNIETRYYKATHASRLIPSTLQTLTNAKMELPPANRSAKILPEVTDASVVKDTKW